jgi:ornithine cyclodeaminase/alanine dehydrogenase-like protein (mu-crystallin family)
VPVLVLSQEDVYAALAPDACERAMVEVLVARARGDAYEPLRTIMAAPGAPGFLGLMPAWRAGGDGREGRDGPDGRYSLKTIVVTPSNPRERGIDAHQGTVTVFDGDSGEPTAILNASAVTEIRTAATTAAATRALAREDAHVLGILGAGVQGRAHVRAFDGLRDWSEIRVYAPTRAHAQAVAEAATDPTRARAAASAEEAVRDADVVVLATNSRTPVVQRNWLTEGAHVNAVGAGTLSAWEIDVATVGDSAFFCDSRVSVLNEAGEFRAAVEQGAISGESHIRAELGEVLAGMQPGRQGPAELTLFRSLGIGVEDLAAAELAVATARRQGLGTEVEL